MSASHYTYLRSGAELSRAVGRLDEVRVLTTGLPTIDHVPPGRVTALARFATVAKAQAVSRMPLERRMATLLAFVRTLEATAQDDVLDLFDIVVTTLFNDAAKVGKKARLRTIRDLDAAALQLRQAGGVLMDDAVKDDAVREAAFATVPRAMFAAALEQIDAIVTWRAIVNGRSNGSPTACGIQFVFGVMCINILTVARGVVALFSAGG